MSTVAVIVPTIPTRRKMLRRALASVWAQTREPEFVIVATDTHATGAGPTRNRAWRNTSADWIATLDDDDEFMPRHLEVLMRCAEDTGADAVYPWFELRGWPEATPQRPDPLAVMHHGQLRHPLGVPFGPEQADHMRRYPFIPVTGLYRRELLDAVDGWPTPGTDEWQRPDWEDWGLWLRILDAPGKIVHYPARTWVCNFHAGSTAGKPWRERTGV